MTHKHDLEGVRFGKLVVIERIYGLPKTYWLCQCDCGNQTKSQTALLNNGTVKSCGCYRREMGIKRGKNSSKHGEGSNGKETVEYRTWAAMLSRCNNRNHKVYKHYGGRGISVCPEWSSYENFLDDMGRRPSDSHSIDRIDVNGNYCKENCRWADIKTQNRNTRGNRNITIGDKTKCLAEWYEILNVSKSVRTRVGVNIEAYLKSRYEEISNQEWNWLTGHFMIPFFLVWI